MQNVVTTLPKLTPRQGHLILAATILGSSIVFLDGTIVTVALPQIQKEFHTSVSGLQWLIDIYILFLSVPILVAGSLSDRYGRRKLFNLGLIGFTLASMICGAAANMNQLILARIFQGISGALILPSSLAILNTSFPAENRGRVMGIWSAFTPLATAIGPLLGGWLVDNVTWRAAFYINLPLGLTAFFLSLRFVPESKSEKVPESQDWWGAFLVTVGLGSLIFGLIEGPKRGWADPLVAMSIVMSITFLVAFGIVESKVAHPMIPFALFKHRTFSGVTLMTFILYFAMSGVFFFLTLNLQQVQQLSATQAGAAFMPIIILLFLMSLWSGRYADRVGPRQLLIVGPIIIAIGFFMYMIPGLEANYWLTFFPATVMFGIGLGITVAPLTTVALGSVPTNMSGLASGVSNAAARIASMLAVALLGFVMVLQFGASLESQLQELSLASPNPQYWQEEKLKLGGAEPPPGLSPELTAGVQAIIDQAFVDAFRVMMGLCGVLALVSAAVSAATISNQLLHHDEHQTPIFEIMG